MFQVASLTKAFGGQVLFQDVSFRIDAGDRVGLVGPNGAGKTTLLRILAGEEPADDGELAIPKGARIGYLPQEVRVRTSGTVLHEVMGAVPEIGAIEREMAELEAAMATAPPDKASELAHHHGELLDRYHALDGYSHEARAREILAGLGFADGQLDDGVATLSGGWGMRVELARLLLARPELLLLDEPTNHLDLESLEWLESFLQDYKGAWVVVSHDRYFLNRMATKIVDLSQTVAFVFPGNYDAYLKAREELQERLEKEAAQRQKRIDEIEGFIERFRYKASKARQAQSRVKMIEKLRKEQAELAPVSVPKRRKKIHLRLPDPPRSGDRVIELDRVRKAYGDNVVYESLSFQAKRGEKVALVGVNGAGKTTMLKLLAAELRPDGGARELGHNVNAYYFAQHQVDMLDTRKTVLRELWDTMLDESETRVRGILGAFLFSGDDVDKTVGVLSGGEKSRLALAKMLGRPANLLLLDEPTNHLDLESREVLEAALATYKGTIIFISHDRYFINRIANRVAEVRVGGHVTDYPGDYDYYIWKRAQLEAEKAGARAAAPRKDSAKKKKNESARKDSSARKPDASAKRKDGAPKDAKGHREASKKAARESARRAREAERIETEIAAGEARIKEIDALMCDPDVYADAARCKELLAERGKTEDKVTALYEAWESLTSQSA